jgi:hypothetical protein
MLSGLLPTREGLEKDDNDNKLRRFKSEAAYTQLLLTVSGYIW